MKKLLLGLFVFCLLFTGTSAHAGWVSDAVLREILQFRAALGASAFNIYPPSYVDTSISTKVVATPVIAAPVPTVPTVLAPNGGEIIKMGSTYPIKWKASVGVSTVNIYIDTGIRCVVAPCPSNIVIANGVKNTGSYSWYVNPKITYGNGSGLRMFISNGNYSDSSDATFSIAAATIACPPAPSLAQCPPGTTSSVIYDANKCVIGQTSCVPIVVTCPPAPSLAQCPTGTTSSLIYDVNKCVTGQVCTSDVVTCPVGCTCTETSVNCPATTPSVTVLYPNGGETYTAGQQMTIKWNATNTFNNKVSLGLVDLTGAEYPIAYDIDNSGSYNWTIPSELKVGCESGTCIIPFGQNIFKVIISDDGSPRLYDSSNNLFTINNTATCPSIIIPDVLCAPGTMRNPTYDANKCITSYTDCTPIAMCDYAAPANGCTYIKGPDYNSTNGCGMVLDCSNITKCLNGAANPPLCTAIDCANGEVYSSSNGQKCQNPETYWMTLISPEAGKTLNAGETYNVRWTSNIPSYGFLVIRITDNNNRFIREITTANDGQETVSIPSTTASGTYKLEISNGSVANKVVYANAVFNIASITDTGCLPGQNFSSTTGAACTVITPSTPITRTLKTGMRGDDVKTLQAYLGLTADGYFGRSTRIKVIQWQKANGLRADGVFGPSSILKSGLGISSN